MRPTDHLTFPQLAALTERYAVGLGLGSIKVLPLTVNESSYLDGRTDGRTFVQYPRDGAPAHAVAHEIAHWMADDEHGPRWSAWFVTLARLLDDVTVAA